MAWSCEDNLETGPPGSASWKGSAFRLAFQARDMPDDLGRTTPLSARPTHHTIIIAEATISHEHGTMFY